MSSPPNFSLVRAEVPWVNADGTPTAYFFRLIANMFGAAGAGIPPNLTALVNYTISQSPHGGTDKDRQIADLMTMVASIPDYAGRIATLESRIADLERMIYESQSPTVDVNPMKNQIDSLTALVMGSH